MIWSILALSCAVCLLVAVLGDRAGRLAFALAAAPMTAAFVWATASLVDGGTSRTQVTWVDELQLNLGFRVDAFSIVLAMLVTGIGAMVCLYAAGYFSAGTSGTGRFAATILAFATSMLGLVLADTAWTFFVFWELTSITSFLLIGHKQLDGAARRAARRALVITAAGGLVLLAGFVLLLDASGVERLSELAPISGGTATGAALLIMIAAATKSAQVPFHVWLPGAMAAPTPVSAYLHSATMVKAGVVLVAVASPALSGVVAWKVAGVTAGAASMLWGAIGALRHHDAKLILAWGTISQLGLMVTLLSLGNAKATFAAVSILVAHAVFKATLFMVVGEIDVRTGTRDVRELNGLWRSMPVAFGAALVSAASMAGIPPLVGFPAKEAAVESALGLDGFERAAVLVLVVVGSVLTVAYTTRLMIATFGGRATPTAVRPVRTMMAVPAVVLAAASVLGYAWLGPVSDAARDAAVTIDPAAGVYRLLRWPGLTDAFVISIAIVAAGAATGAWLARTLTGRSPDALGARAVDVSIDGLVAAARRVAGRVQHGSLPGYVLTIAAVAAISTVPFWSAIDLSAVHRWDNSAQAALAGLVVVAVAASTVVASRLGAALVLGAVGLIVTGLFVAHGAPDLVLTQLLVETVIVVGFVVGLGGLTSRFPPVAPLWLSARIAVALAAAVAVAAALIAGAGRPTGDAATDRLAPLAVEEGGGSNVVNVILTDVRALDTLGEIIVLVVVAVGILSLLRRSGDVDGAHGSPS